MPQNPEKDELQPRPQANDPETGVTRRPLASSDTPPPISLPGDIDSVWDSIDASAEVVSEPSRPEVQGDPPAASFSPAFTLVGHGHPEASDVVAPPVRFAPGSQFGVYLVGACIGEGGMARVYQAEHAGLRRQVALKVLIDGFARDPDGRERFVREARMAAAIKHPNVVNIFDVGIHDEIPYLVMEFLEGQDLEKLLEAKGALEESLIIDIMVPVVAGLLAVHDAGIIHRDLKPGNIFLSRGRYSDLEPKLLDFGISKAQGGAHLRLTANDVFMGTPFYVSPEALRGGEMTPLSDQYSLGVVMYECATGVAPFRASSLLELSSLIGSGQYTPPAVHKPELSQRLARIIERAMSLDPQDRFKDLREMGCELLTLAGQRTRITWGLSFGAPGLDTGDIKHVPVSQKVIGNAGQPAKAERRRKGAAFALIGVATFFVFLFILFAWRPEKLASNALEHGQPLPAARAATTAESPLEARNDPTVAATRPVETVIAAPSAATPANKPEVSAPVVPNPVVPKDRGATARDLIAPARAASRQVSRPNAPAGRKGVGADPEWALPSSYAAPTSGKPTQVGANDAPILD